MISIVSVAEAVEHGVSTTWMCVCVSVFAWSWDVFPLKYWESRPVGIKNQWMEGQILTCWSMAFKPDWLTMKNVNDSGNGAWINETEGLWILRVLRVVDVAKKPGVNQFVNASDFTNKICCPTGYHQPAEDHGLKGEQFAMNQPEFHWDHRIWSSRIVGGRW